MQALLERKVAVIKKTSAKKSVRNIGLDIVRTIAILIVIFYHSSPLLIPLCNNTVYGRMVKGFIDFSTWFGPLGVDLFFVLSGFLIGTIIIKTFLHTNNYNFSAIKNFWIRRWFRTIPNYFLLLSLAFVVYNYMYGTKFEWRYYLFIQNLFNPHPSFFAEAWSLAVEEWFYISVPIVLLLCNKIFKGKEKKKVLKYTFLYYLFLFIIIRCIKAVIHDYSNLDTEIRKVVLFRLDSIMYGVIIAYLMYYQKKLLFKLRLKLLISGVTGVGAFTFIFWFGTYKHNFYQTNVAFRLFIDSSYYTFIPFFFSLCMPFAYFIKSNRNPFIIKIVTHISIISYSMYLLHYALIYIPFFENVKTYSISSAIAIYLCYWLLVFLTSTANFYLFEKPITRMREYLSTKERV